MLVKFLPLYDASQVDKSHYGIKNLFKCTNTVLKSTCSCHNLSVSFPAESVVSGDEHCVNRERRMERGRGNGGGAGEGDKLGQIRKRGNRVGHLPINLFHHVQLDCTCMCGQ